MTAIQPTTSREGLELTGATMSHVKLSPLAILTDIICAEPEFDLLRETMKLYSEEVQARS
jgi:hypothetical protein